MGDERGGELGDGGAKIAGPRWRFSGAGGEKVAPGGDAFDDVEEGEDFEGFEGGAGDAGLIEKGRRIEEAVEIEAAAAGEEGAKLGGAGLLGGDPGEVGGGLEGEGVLAAKGADGFGGDVVAEARELEGCGGGFEKGRGDFGEERGHGFLFLSHCDGSDPVRRSGWVWCCIHGHVMWEGLNERRRSG